MPKVGSDDRFEVMLVRMPEKHSSVKTTKFKKTLLKYLGNSRYMRQEKKALCSRLLKEKAKAHGRYELLIILVLKYVQGLW